MTDTATVARSRDDWEPASPPVVHPELADQLLARAEAGGVELLGTDGLLSQVTKAVLERALAEEMTGHLGYEKHDRRAAGRVQPQRHDVQDAADRCRRVGAGGSADRAGSFEPQIARKGQTRLEGFNERIIALYARVI